MVKKTTPVSVATLPEGIHPPPMAKHDEEETLRGAAISIAQQVARECAEVQRDSAPDYLKEAMHDKHQTWMPHEWVITAIVTALKAGMKWGEEKAERSNLHVQEQLDEHYREAQTTMIRACVAGIMEAGVTTNPDDIGKGVAQCTLNLDSQRTIWDRCELETKRNPEETEVTFTLHRN